MERNRDQIKCRFCHFYFTPEPVILRDGKKRRVYTECPRCGNGIESAYSKKYAMRMAAAANG